MQKTKYHSTKVRTPDGNFDSKKEYRRWLQLKEWESRGIISNLRRQVVYELIPSQKEGKKVAERAVKYIADFVYITTDGVEVVEDTKGVKTDAYKIKRKLMLYMHKIKIKEV